GIRMLFGIPYIVSLRGGDVPGFRPYDFAVYHRLIGPLLHIVWRKASAVVANSAGLRALGEKFDDSIDIKTIPNGVNINQFVCTERNWEPAKLLIVGRVVYQKGIDLLLRALAGIPDLEWVLRVAGDGPLRAELLTLAGELGIAERVEFLGWQSKDELVKRYCEANLYVYPSRHEGMPNVVLEAMSSGLPVIASEIAGNEELVIPGETGLLVPEDDSAELLLAIRSLIRDAGLRK
ncbi:MAG: glycosyltransferase family 4 protein, partial [Chloroflexota bacterium]